ncbi:MAG: DnaJ domain-containing protein [Microthrixaceae bacterium]
MSPGPSDQYAVLGIPADATAAQVRAAYLAAARTAHPDRHIGDPLAAAAAEERMRELNAAWAELGDPVRRAAHDRRLGLGSAATTTGGPHLARPARDFTPLADDEPDEDDWRHEPDPYDPRTGIGRVLGAGPPLLFLAAIGIGVAGAMTGVRALLAVALTCALVALLAFIGVPLVALARSKAHDPG